MYADAAGLLLSVAPHRTHVKEVMASIVDS